MSNEMQLSLLERRETGADRALGLLTQRYVEGCRRLCGERPLTTELDNLSFAAVKLVTEYSFHLDERSGLQALRTCLSAAAHNTYLDAGSSRLAEIQTGLDQLPWELAIQLFESRDSRWYANLLLPYLGHSNSSIRHFALQLGWLLRKHLGFDDAREILFQNIADTLGYVEESTSLAHATFEDDEDFYDAASHFRDERWQYQFDKRIRATKEKGLLIVCSQQLRRMESEAERLILEVAMGLPAVG